MDSVIRIFLFNIFLVILFAFVYSVIDSKNFQPLNTNDKLTFIDYLFYSTTIQAGVGLPDITAVTNLSKLLAMIQQIILMGSSLIILRYFIVKK
jgi:hypothetical protein